jgi:outer membrane protein OmpA-like peptidoglycan-associated protein
MRPAGGGSFETPARVSTPGQRAATVRATFTAGGDALVAWRYNATIPLVLVGQARRPAGGSWQPAEVASTTGAVTNSLALAAGGSDGSSFLAYVDTGDLLGGGPSALPVGRWVDGQPDGAGLHPLLSPDYFPSEVVLGADGAGNAAAGWIQWGDEMQVRLAGFDATPPVIERFDVPATAVAGKPLTLAAEAPDVWSETSYAWVVRRDGSGEEVALTGATPSYDFPVAGNYTVELIASDMDGRAAPPASAHVAVEVQPGDPPRPPVEEPRAPAEEPRAAAEEPRAPVAEPRAPATRPRPRTRPRLRVVRAPRTVVGKGGRLRVACRLSTRTLRGCTVRVTGRRVATVAPGLAGARAAAQRVLAEGRVTLSRPASGAVVDVRLGAELREHVAGALGGVPVTVEIVARTRDGRTLKTTARTVLLAARQQVVTPIGAFGADDGALTDAGDRFLRGVARELRGASAIRCTGHTASLFPGDVTGYAWRLGLARARTACAALRAYGVRVPLTADTRGKRDPLQSNATEPGREANRRVTLTIVRRAG